MKIFVYPYLNNDEMKLSAEKVIGLLEEEIGASCFLSKNDSIALYGNTSKVCSPEECEIIVSIGGDGTVLRAASIAMEYSKPLFGINSGHLGYLCACNMEELSSFGKELFSNISIVERMLLDLSIDDKKVTVLNDVVIAKNYVGSTATLTIDCDTNGEMELRGDGLIIATPTGSTAYNFSAGGPIVDVSSSSLIVTPICSHKGLNRPLVLSHKTVLKVYRKRKDEPLADIYADGIKIGPLEDKIEITASSKKLMMYTKKNKIATFFN